tara:strand:+ start:523 stop:1206 length:684 start_codon:yes stop_codon:yes gene_type:complete
MANVNVSGILKCSDGTIIPLDATLAEGTESNLTTNTDYTVSASNAGDYAPGKTITHGYIQADHNISYAYILRQGLIATIIPVGVKGLAGSAPLPLCRPFTLIPGDIVRVLASTAASRATATCVYTNQGVYRIFDVASASGNVEPVDLQTNNSVGDTLQGQVIMKAFTTAGSLGNAELVDAGGCLMLNEKGMPVGAVPANSPANQPVFWSDVQIPVALNYVWRITSSA